MTHIIAAVDLYKNLAISREVRTSAENLHLVWSLDKPEDAEEDDGHIQKNPSRTNSYACWEERPMEVHHSTKTLITTQLLYLQKTKIMREYASVCYRIKIIKSELFHCHFVCPLKLMNNQ